MKYFKCLAPNLPVFGAIERAVGKHGVWEVIKAVFTALELDISRIDPEDVSRWAGVKKDRAEKLFPFAQELLAASRKLYKSTENLGKSQEISENPIDFTPSNPHGYGIAVSKEKEEEDISNSITYPPTPKGGGRVKIQGVKKTKKTAVIVPPDWQPDPAFTLWLKEHHPMATDEDLAAEVQGLKDYSAAHGQGYCDFDAALRNRFGNEFWKQRKERSARLNSVRLNNVDRHGNRKWCAASGDDMIHATDEPLTATLSYVFD